MENQFKKSGSRLIANHIKIQHGRNGQYFATIPSSVVEAAELDHGSILYFKRVDPITKEITIEPMRKEDE